MTIRLARLLLGGGLAVASSYALAAGNDDLTVAEAVWTSAIDNRQYVGRVNPGARVKSLYFWTRLKGGAKALEVLKKEGKLPITHHWIYPNVFKEDNTAISPDQEFKVLPAGSIADDNGGIASVVSNGQNFLWRTWSHKESLRRGKWTVLVKYADGQPLKCGSEDCRWTIEIQ